MSAGSALKRSLEERRRVSAPEGRRRAGAPSCAGTKTTCLGAVCQQESHALQEERIKRSQRDGIRVRYFHSPPSINPFLVMEVSQGAAPKNALTLSDLKPGAI